MPMRQPATIDVVVYLVVEPRFKGTWASDDKGRPILDSAKVVRALKNRPDFVDHGGVTTKLTLRMPSSVFLPLEPTAIVEVLEGDVETYATTEAPS